MASPFENLIQAAQFGVQTRMGYDQMVEKRRENTQNLLQRRAEQEQQNQQFLAEMNVKDRQLKMQSEQFNQNMGLERQKLQQQDKQFSQELGFRKESFGKEFGLKKEAFDFDKAFKTKQQEFDFSRGAYSQRWYDLEYYKYRDRDAQGKTIEKEYKGPFIPVKTPAEGLWGPDKMGRFDYAWKKGKEASANSPMPFTASILGMAKGAWDYSTSQYAKKHQMTAEQYVQKGLGNFDAAVNQAMNKNQRIDPLTAADNLNSIYNAIASNYEDFNRQYGEARTNTLLNQVMTRARQFGIPLEQVQREQYMAGSKQAPQE
jgi:hypothetical protein